MDLSPGELYLYKGLRREDHRSLENHRSDKHLTLESNASPKEISFQNSLSQYASQYDALCPPAARAQSLGRETDGYALQYSSLENPKDRGAWWATVHESQEPDLTG